MKPLVATWRSIAGSRVFWCARVETLSVWIDAVRQWLVSPDDNRRPWSGVDGEIIEVLGWHEACVKTERPGQSEKEKVPC
jgi:hypothetical protein